MSFVSWQYLAFVATTWLLFWFSETKWRMHLLLFASYIFYGAWSYPCLALILLTTSIDYFCARSMASSKETSLRKRMLWIGICSNLAVLCIFKYTNFILSFPHGFLSLFGIQAPSWHFDVILPLGISFYTFEAISYLVDVYRGSAPAPNWLSYNFYIMFFPHLIAGPIVRFNRFFPQYANGLQRPDNERLKLAAKLLLLGFISKLVIADSMALANRDLMQRASTLSTFEAFMVAASFGIQVFFDFQGYTYIARGTAFLFNIELPINFRNPEHAGNIAEFWQRWNITLSKWLYDYVYLPMGGGRKSVKARMTSSFLTMFVAGIWHGAGWNYVLLGTYFGLLVAVYHGYRSFIRSFPNWNQARKTVPYKVAACLITQYALLFAAILFNADLRVDLCIIERLLPFSSAAGSLMPAAMTPVYWGLLFCIFIAACGHAYVRPLYHATWERVPFWLRVQTVTAVVIVCAVLETQQTDMSFIYAQF